MLKIGITGFVVYLIIGLYLLNVPFGLIPMPGFIQGINEWIVFIGGVLVIIGGVNYLRAGRGY